MNWRNSPNVNERRLPSTPPVAQKHLRALETAMIQVGRLAAVGGINASEALGHRFSCRLVDDGQISDGRFGSAGLPLREVLFQRSGLVRQSGHHKVVGHTVTLVLDHGWVYLNGRSKKMVKLYCGIDGKLSSTTFTKRQSLLLFAMVKG